MDIRDSARLNNSVYCVGEEGGVLLVMPDTAVFWAIMGVLFGRVEFW